MLILAFLVLSIRNHTDRLKISCCRYFFHRIVNKNRILFTLDRSYSTRIPNQRKQTLHLGPPNILHICHKIKVFFPNCCTLLRSINIPVDSLIDILVRNPYIICSLQYQEQFFIPNIL